MPFTPEELVNSIIIAHSNYALLEYISGENSTYFVPMTSSLTTQEYCQNLCACTGQMNALEWRVQPLSMEF